MYFVCFKLQKKNHISTHDSDFGFGNSRQINVITNQHSSKPELISSGPNHFRLRDTGDEEMRSVTITCLRALYLSGWVSVVSFPSVVSIPLESPP